VAHGAAVTLTQNAEKPVVSRKGGVSSDRETLWARSSPCAAISKAINWKRSSHGVVAEITGPANHSFMPFYSDPRSDFGTSDFLLLTKAKKLSLVFSWMTAFASDPRVVYLGTRCS